jgi:hypothetical protein
MRLMSVLFISLCLMVTAAAPSLAAKDKKHGKHDGKMDEQAMMEEFKRLGTPGDPHKVLASLEGSWQTKTKEWMEPGKPPMESTGTADMKMLLDGRFLQQELSGDMMGQPYKGLGVLGYDNLRKKYVTTWIDSMGTGIFYMEGTGSADGKTITLKGSHAMPGGGSMTHRAIWKIVDENAQTFEMYGSHGKEKESKNMEITYTRK